MEEYIGRLYSLTVCEYALFLVEDNTNFTEKFSKKVLLFLIFVSILPVLCAIEVFL